MTPFLVLLPVAVSEAAVTAPNTTAANRNTTTTSMTTVLSMRVKLPPAPKGHPGAPAEAAGGSGWRRVATYVTGAAAGSGHRAVVADLLAAPRTAVATTLGLGTALRGQRLFHPRGQAYDARLEVTGGADRGARLLDEAGSHSGLVRLSRGVGLPAGLPDVEGLALRLPGLGVDGAPLDLLVNSAWRFTFAPAVLSPTWSSVLPYHTGSGRLVLLGARPTPDGFTLLLAAPLGRWQPWGQLSVGREFDGERLRFAPTIGADDLQPVALFRSLRARSYDASQARRD